VAWHGVAWRSVARQGAVNGAAGGSGGAAGGQCAWRAACVAIRGVVASRGATEAWRGVAWHGVAPLKRCVA